jgi:hypothetical protein
MSAAWQVTHQIPKLSMLELRERGCCDQMILVIPGIPLDWREKLSSLWPSARTIQKRFTQVPGLLVCMYPMMAAIPGRSCLASGAFPTAGGGSPLPTRPSRLTSKAFRSLRMIQR